MYPSRYHEAKIERAGKMQAGTPPKVDMTEEVDQRHQRCSKDLKQKFSADLPLVLALKRAAAALFAESPPKHTH